MEDKKPITDTNDLEDSPKDKKELQPEEITIDMPEIFDIPGQENIIPPRMKEMEDVTISSDDEEGKGLLDDLNTKEEDEK